MPTAVLLYVGFRRPWSPPKRPVGHCSENVILVPRSLPITQGCLTRSRNDRDAHEDHDAENLDVANVMKTPINVTRREGQVPDRSTTPAAPVADKP